VTIVVLAFLKTMRLSAGLAYRPRGLIGSAGDPINLAIDTQARNSEKLEELLAYLRARQPFLPNYRQRYIARRYIGSGHTEKLNDQLVARRQKGAGRHWSLETSDALAALRTLLLNGGWTRYWEHRQVLPLLAC